ncbi:unnamed protein product [Eruca vesicaria subsp. sativa]|uniref:Uncharacterized protein n=1 Tax=Eruca vesicaria subsp. sativa TaxID=29727 RepID=A0ABC8J789_ERUVS|nr:unnamed protein product [Eruca vesicaria subsp. sativa]
MDSLIAEAAAFGEDGNENSTIITVYPQVLIIADSLGPKRQFLKSRGASVFELAEVLSKVPKILGSKKTKL